MKVECSKEKFCSAVSKSEKVTGKNMTLPILSCILIEAKNNLMIFKATNLDLGIEVSIPAKVSKEGLVAVPGSVLNGFLANLSSDNNLLIEEKDGNLHISNGSSQATIKSHPTDDFPSIPRVKDGKSHEISSSEFVKGLKAVNYSASFSSIKPELSSVYIHADSEGLLFVATDSFRLAEKRIKGKKTEDFGQILIPFKNVNDLLKIIGDEKDLLEINFTKNQISLTYKDTYIVSRVIDGIFPDYKQIIPKEFKTEVVLLKQDLINTLKISNIFSDSFNQINIKVSPSDKKLELKTKNTNIGENVNKLSAVITGEAIEINFNYKYIIDCFQSIDSDSVSLSFNGLNKPMVIRGVSDKTFTYLVMPMNR
ncbi:MAG: DNA polymerase III subunit beta [Candidatus Paceibacterota bacterium]